MVKNAIKIFARLKPEGSEKKTVTYRIHRRPKKHSHEDFLTLTGPQKMETDYVNNRRESWNFSFHRIFDESVGQGDIFESLAQPAVESALNGYNATILAYGQTGSGKTYSITGEQEKYEQRGILPRTIEYLFNVIRNNPKDLYYIEVSYLEIYNENGYDLLDRKYEIFRRLEDLPFRMKKSTFQIPGGKEHVSISGGKIARFRLTRILARFDLTRITARFGLTRITARFGSTRIMAQFRLTRIRVVIQEDENGMLHLKNLTFRKVSCERDALSLLLLGNTNRAISETPMNLQSSRSHCIFTIVVSVKRFGAENYSKAKMHVVDLAGSERVYKCSISGTILTEAKYINLTLHYLEQVIVCLGQENTNHIPYRNSLLTAILRDSLGGNCLTSMLANISTGASNLQETISTCRFAQRVALVRNDVNLVFEKDPDDENMFLRMEVDRLKEQIARLTGEDMTEDLTEDEKTQLNKRVTNFLESDASINWDNDRRKIDYCLEILRKNIRSGDCGRQISKIEDTRSVEYYRNLVVQRDKEISVLINLLKKTKSVMLNHSNSHESVKSNVESKSSVSGICNESCPEGCESAADLNVRGKTVIESLANSSVVRCEPDERLAKNSKKLFPTEDLSASMKSDTTELQIPSTNDEKFENRTANGASSLKSVPKLRSEAIDTTNCRKLEIRGVTIPIYKSEDNSVVVAEISDTFIVHRRPKIEETTTIRPKIRDSCLPQEESTNVVEMVNESGFTTKSIAVTDGNHRKEKENIASLRTSKSLGSTRQDATKTNNISSTNLEFYCSKNHQESNFDAVRDASDPKMSDTCFAAYSPGNRLSLRNFVDAIPDSRESSRSSFRAASQDVFSTVFASLPVEQKITTSPKRVGSAVSIPSSSTLLNIGKKHSDSIDTSTDALKPVISRDELIFANVPKETSEDAERVPKKIVACEKTSDTVDDYAKWKNGNGEDEEADFMRSLPLTGDAEIDEEIVAFYRAKRSGGIY